MTSFRHHPFVVPVVTFMFLIFASLFAFVIFGGGSTIGPTDSRVVNLYVDGQKQILPTRAPDVQTLLAKQNIKINQGDVVEPSLDSPIIDDNFNVNVYRSREVMIVDGDKKTVVKTADQSPRIAARNAGIIIYPEDQMAAEAPESIADEGVVGERYVINRSIPATLILYGNVTAIRSLDKTVGAVLDEHGVKVSPQDTITPSRDAPLTADMKITVTRPGQQIQTAEEVIEPPQETVDDPNVNKGVTVVKEPGVPGKRIVTYDIKTENGVEVSRTKLQEIIAVQPQRQLISRGTKIIISNPSENVKIGEQMAAARGWTGQQWYCLYQLWQRESKWSTTAGNTSTGAYGIPQSLPGSKMAANGADWQSNPATQIAWGLGYITRSYGTPCGAWQSSESRGWY